MVTRRTRHAFWWRPKIEQLLQLHQDLWTEMLESGKRRRIIDFHLAVGKIQARVQDDSGKMFRCELLVPPFEQPLWNCVIEELSQHSLCLGAFCAGNLPEEVDTTFRAKSAELVPDQSVLIHRCECKKEWCGHQISLWDRFRERVDEDPFALFILRGKTREEVIEILRQNRALKQRSSLLNESLDVAPSQLLYQTQEFWKKDPVLQQLSYDIRADELPAALLKRMEPAPLDGVDIDADRALEEAYVQVARRAQAFGLGMIRQSQER